MSKWQSLLKSFFGLKSIGNFINTSQPLLILKLIRVIAVETVKNFSLRLLASVLIRFQSIFLLVHHTCLSCSRDLNGLL